MPSRPISRRSALRALAGGVGLLAACDPREFARKRGATQRISVATGPVGGVYYVYGGAIAAVITRHVQNVEATAEATGASIDNLKFIAQDEADLGLVLADTLADAHNGTGAFETFGRVNARALARLYTNYMHIVTLEKSGITSLEQLRGRRVSTGSPGSGSRTIAHRMLASVGIDPVRDMRETTLGVNVAAEAMRDGKIDALFWSSGVPTGPILDLASSPGHRIRLIPNDQTLAPLTKKYGAGLYERTIIPVGAYPGVAEEVPAVGVSNLLVVSGLMSDDLAFDITRALFEHRAELVAVHPEAEHLALPFSAEGSPVPFHPGALRYYSDMTRG